MIGTLWQYRARPADAVFRRLALGCFLALTADAAGAQIFKCVDSAGRTTYQQAPCLGGQQGKELQLQTDNGSTRGPDAGPRWSAIAAERRVVTGMPKPWVVQAMGPPKETRPPRNGESGSEVWVYPSPEGTLRVGFIGDSVAWNRKDASDAAPAVGDAEKMRRFAARGAVKAGRDCNEAVADLGPPDREEPVIDVDPTSGRARPGPPTVRYTYEPAAGDPHSRTSFTCMENRVIDVERTLVR